MIESPSKRYLVTGGSGFIGSHLADFLVGRGDAVVALDDLSTGSCDNVAHLLASSGFELIRGDAGDATLLRKLLPTVDGVFHLAATVGVRLIIERPIHTIENNLTPTATLLREAARTGTPTLIASSSEVYGRGIEVPFREDQDVVLGPTHKARWAYACSKMLDEFLALAYRREHGLGVVAARLFNTVGPRQSGQYGMVLPTFAHQALSGEAITVFGDGLQTRSFTFVGDVVIGLAALLDTEAAHGEVVNLGSEHETTILALAERVRDRAESTSPITLIPYSQAYEAGFDDMLRRVPSCAKAQRLCGWKATTSLDDIIDAVIEERRR